MSWQNDDLPTDAQSWEKFTREPADMLKVLSNCNRINGLPRYGERTMRLAGVGCARLLPDFANHEVLDLIELAVDNPSPEFLQVLQQHNNKATKALEIASDHRDQWLYWNITRFAAIPFQDAMSCALDWVAFWVGQPAPCCDIIRDVFGNPWDWIKSEASLDQAKVHPTVVAMANYIYNLKDFSCVPQLGDALEENGCTSRMVLDHCRAEKPHVRGCWVLDYILGKE